jgi:phosphoribosyl-ATP pyrophosphohydrolase/phosphoribosyl-AMP cyclohydrolase
VDMSAKLEQLIEECRPQVLIRDSLIRNDLAELLAMKQVVGVSTNHFEDKDIYKAKRSLKQQGIDVEVFESAIDFSDFKTLDNGLIPTVVQDYRTDEVLMVAYMNEESFRHTLETGKMTYYSRSRKELWCKGDTSGHYQYVKKLMIDCDNDTILAKVHQIGAACHTGNRSCFFRELAHKDYINTNPLAVLSEDYQVICERKKHPREGSYTNYLFDQGLDKILKKLGEEFTEIIIAAKNPTSEEIKYEVADFLYHCMVLMVEKGVTWEEITNELARR